MRNNRSFLIVLVLGMCMGVTGFLKAQLFDEEAEQRKGLGAPQSIDFSKMFEEKNMEKEDLDDWKTKRETKLRERLERIDVLEKAVNPHLYIVGPGDIFSFNVWGAMEIQIPIKVNVEGKLIIPTVGEIFVDGLTLSEAQKKTLDKARAVYEKNEISLSLESPRFFRVHVVGEVKFPGTYIAQAGYRISEIITEAGGVSEFAWKQQVELRSNNGSSNLFNLAEFEHTGVLESDLFVNGGDVIYVPSLSRAKAFVTVEGDLQNSGVYPIQLPERLLDFLGRLKSLSKNVDITKILVIRKSDSSENSDSFQYYNPFNNANNMDFTLEHSDRILIPSSYVYVKGAVSNPGAYPYGANLRALDYVGMAGGDYRSGSVKSCYVYHALTGKKEKGADVIVEAGDVVHLNQSLSLRTETIIKIIPTFTSLILAAKAAGFWD